jgi:hypothetical protein
MSAETEEGASKVNVHNIIIFRERSLTTITIFRAETKEGANKVNVHNIIIFRERSLTTITIFRDTVTSVDSTDMVDGVAV